MENKEIIKTESCECVSCNCNFLAFTNTKEYELKICYRCFLNGMADSYLARKQDKT